MKKLSKIKLQDAVVLEDREMKTIVGGIIGPCDPFAITCSGLCQTVYGKGTCMRNADTYLYCACVLVS
jgi:natural product precursor